MDKLLILGSSPCSAEIIACAKEMGVYTIVTDYWPVERSYAKQLSDEHWLISTNDLDALEKKCREENVTAVTCGINEFNQDMALELCERLGLPNYATKDAWHYNRDKADFKALCKKVGAPVATDYYISEALSDEEINAVQFPVVLKPVDKYGNQGVSFCYNREDLIKAYHFARAISKHDRVVVERLIKGEEYFSLYAIADGQISLIGVMSSYSQPGEPSFCYLVNTTVCRFVQHYLDHVDQHAKNVLKAAGCKEGIAWIQLMHDQEDDQDYLIEMGYRLCGDLTFIPLEHINHFDAVKWMVECALGVKHTPQDLPKPQEKPYSACACSYMVWAAKACTIGEVRGLEEVSKIPGVHVSRNPVYPGDKVPQYRQIGNILFASKDCDSMCDMIELINQVVSVSDDNGQDIMMHYNDYETLKDRYARSLVNS